MAMYMYLTIHVLLFSCCANDNLLTTSGELRLFKGVLLCSANVAVQHFNGSTAGNAGADRQATQEQNEIRDSGRQHKLHGQVSD